MSEVRRRQAQRTPHVAEASGFALLAARMIREGRHAVVELDERGLTGPPAWRATQQGRDSR